MSTEHGRSKIKRAAGSTCPDSARGWIVILAWGLPALLALVLVSGCGFKLRGQVELPPAMHITYIKVNRPAGTPPGTLERTLESFLKANGVTVTTDPKQATATLEIVNQEQASRIVGTTREGDSRLYTLTYNVDYRVVLPDGKTLLPQIRASVSRDILYPESAVLSKSQGEQVAYRQMEYEVVRAIFYRLEALGRNQ